jgi:hypothetical protein
VMGGTGVCVRQAVSSRPAMASIVAVVIVT